MPITVRKDALHIVIYPPDHEPPHVHQFGDAETSIDPGFQPSGQKLGWTYAGPKDAGRAPGPDRRDGKVHAHEAP